MNTSIRKYENSNAKTKPAGRWFALSAIAAGMLASGLAMGQAGDCSDTQYTDDFGVMVIGPPTTTVGVVPERCVGWTSGDAGQECVVNLGYDFGLKIDDWNDSLLGSYSGCYDGQGDDTCDPEFVNTINITGNDGVFFDWTSLYPLRAVVVKGGPDANVFTYADGVEPSVVYGDTDLYSPLNANNGNPFAVSHATFCWNQTDVVGDERCYADETGWAVGLPYGRNWAMYVDYEACDAADGEADGICTTDIRAGGGDGVGLDAGTATLAPDGTGGMVITINLENTFIFYYDLNDDEEDDNLKVQDYASAPGPRDARPGRFDWKTFVPVGSTTGAITVPVNNYYGIHLDLAYQVPCQ
jgi:hypothetical protein